MYRIWNRLFDYRDLAHRAKVFSRFVHRIGRRFALLYRIDILSSVVVPSCKFRSEVRVMAIAFRAVRYRGPS